MPSRAEIDPTDVPRLLPYLVLVDVLDEPDRWRERGLGRAAQFTWERAAAEYEAVYSELL